jgi:uncharacterized membrane protein YhhN
VKPRACLDNDGVTLFVLVAYAVLAAANVASEAVRSQTLDVLTKPLLMPLLAVYVVLACRERGVPVDRRLIVALVLATGGDVALEVPFPGAFILGMLCFLGAYGTYAAMFLRAGALARLRLPVVAGYAVFSAAMLVWLWSALGGLAVPMAVYAAVLTAMAMAAATQGPRVAVGGALLLVSDALIAMRIADAATLPGPPIWVMVTYTLGQALVVTGWVSADRRVAPVP